MLEDGGVESLLFTSDNPKNNKDYGTTDGGTVQYKSFVYRWYINGYTWIAICICLKLWLLVLMTANFKFDGGSELDTLRALQPNKPLHVTEYWPGWFDHWFSPFHCILTLEGMKYWSIHENIYNRFSVINTTKHQC